MKYEDITNEMIVDVLKELYDYQLISFWNDYCDDNKDSDSAIYNMNECLDDFLQGKSPTEILDSVAVNFNTNHSYFSIDGNGYYISFDYLDIGGSPINFEELAKYILNNELDDFIRDCTDWELEEEEEEEDGNYHLYAW